jgi:hypothetical protein
LTRGRQPGEHEPPLGGGGRRGERPGDGLGHGRLFGQSRDEQDRSRGGRRRRCCRLLHERRHLGGEPGDPVGMLGDDPPGRIADERVGIATERERLLARQHRRRQPRRHLIERIDRRAAGAGVGGSEGGQERLRVGRLDEGVGAGVLERPRAGPRNRRQHGLDRRDGADAAERLGGRAGAPRVGAREQAGEQRHTVRVADEAGHVRRRMPHPRARIGEREPHEGNRVGRHESREHPDGVLPRPLRGRRAGQEATEQLDRNRSPRGQGVHRPRRDGRPLVAEQIRERRRGGGRPVDRQPARIRHGRCSEPPHAVDPTAHRRLLQLRRRAAELVPAAGVDHEQRPVGVLDAVGGMEVGGVAGQKRFVGRDERAVRRRERMPRHAPQVEATGEEVARVGGAEGQSRMHLEAAHGGGPAVHERGQEVAGPLVAAQVGRRAAVHAAVEDVNEPVAEAAGGMLDERGRQDPLPLGREGDVDGVVHAAGHHDLAARAVGPGPEDVRRAGLPAGPPRQVVGLLAVPALRPIEPAVAAEVGAMQVVAALRERAAVEPHLPLVGHAVAVAVGELPDRRWGGHVERAGVPERALEHHQPVGERGPPVVDAVAVGVFEPRHAMPRIRLLPLERVVRAARLRHVEPAGLVARDGDGKLDERRAGHPLDREALGHGEREVVEAEFHGGQRAGGQRPNGDQDRDRAARAKHPSIVATRLAPGRGPRSSKGEPGPGSPGESQFVPLPREMW